MKSWWAINFISTRRISLAFSPMKEKKCEKFHCNTHTQKYDYLQLYVYINYLFIYLLYNLNHNIYAIHAGRHFFSYILCRYLYPIVAKKFYILCEEKNYIKLYSINRNMK